MLEEEAATCPEINENICKDMISALPEALLVQLLSLLPTKDAMATSILSKPWRYIWTLLPKLVYNHTNETKRFKLHSGFNLQCAPKPINFPKRLYTCTTLKELTLNTSKAVVEVPSQAFLPSLIKLDLLGVVYKDDDSLVRLLSSCHALQTLNVYRNRDDNVMKFSMKVPSLKTLVYISCLQSGGCLIIDSPRLEYFQINAEDDCLIECMNPSLVMASVHVTCQPDELFWRCLSSVLFLNMILVDATDVFCSAINFSQLIECKLCLCGSEYWVESVMLLLHNSPKLKVLMISSDDMDDTRDITPQRSVPGCLSSPLEIFEWKEYGGTRQEKHILTYILENSKCLKTAGISMMPCYFDFEKEMIMEELKSISRVSVDYFGWTVLNSETRQAMLTYRDLYSLNLVLRKIGESEDLPPRSNVPACLSSQLKILEWVKYGGTREEKKLLECILANSKCLKRAGISMRYSRDCNEETKKKLRDELRSMYRISASSELLFPVKIKWRSVAPHRHFDCDSFYMVTFDYFD